MLSKPDQGVPKQSTKRTSHREKSSNETIP